jgi:hypothetical protein
VYHQEIRRSGYGSETAGAGAKTYLKAGRHVRLLDLRVRIIAQLLDSGRALGPHTFASFSEAEQAIGVIFTIVSPVTLCQSI